MKEVGFKIAQLVSEKAIILFYGPMGAGKTHLIQNLVSAWGVENEVSSPTFSLVNEYEARFGEVYHFDLFRAESLDEIVDFGFTEYLDSGKPCLIEWPEKVESLVDFPYFDIRIKPVEGGSKRSITLARYG